MMEMGVNLKGRVRDGRSLGDIYDLIAHEGVLL